MGVPASEIGYTAATTGRGDHEVHKDMWWHWKKKKEKKRISNKPCLWCSYSVVTIHCTCNVIVLAVFCIFALVQGVYVQLKVQLDVLFICILYSSLFLALHVSCAICTHPQEHKLQRTAIGVCNGYVMLIHWSRYWLGHPQTFSTVRCT
jgi:hypothetical protein